MRINPKQQINKIQQQKLCLHPLTKLGKKQRCKQRAVLCSEQCQTKNAINSAHWDKEHQIVTVQQMQLKIQRADIKLQNDANKYKSSIEETYQYALKHLNQLKGQAINELSNQVQSAKYCSPLQKLSIAKIINKRTDLITCNQVFNLKNYSPSFSKRNLDKLQQVEKRFKQTVHKFLQIKFIEKNFKKNAINEDTIGPKQEKQNQNWKQNQYLLPKYSDRQPIGQKNSYCQNNQLNKAAQRPSFQQSQIEKKDQQIQRQKLQPKERIIQKERLIQKWRGKKYQTQEQKKAAKNKIRRQYRLRQKLNKQNLNINIQKQKIKQSTEKINIFNLNQQQKSERKQQCKQIQRNQRNSENKQNIENQQNYKINSKQLVHYNRQEKDFFPNNYLKEDSELQIISSSQQIRQIKRHSTSLRNNFKKIQKNGTQKQIFVKQQQNPIQDQMKRFQLYRNNILKSYQQMQKNKDYLKSYDIQENQSFGRKKIKTEENVQLKSTNFNGNKQQNKINISNPINTNNSINANNLINTNNAINTNNLINTNNAINSNNAINFNNQINFNPIKFNNNAINANDNNASNTINEINTNIIKSMNNTTNTNSNTIDTNNKAIHNKVISNNHAIKNNNNPIGNNKNAINMNNSLKMNYSTIKLNNNTIFNNDTRQIDINPFTGLMHQPMKRSNIEQQSSIFHKYPYKECNRAADQLRVNQAKKSQIINQQFYRLDECIIGKKPTQQNQIIIVPNNNHSKDIIKNISSKQIQYCNMNSNNQINQIIINRKQLKFSQIYSHQNVKNSFLPSPSKFDLKKQQISKLPTDKQKQSTDKDKKLTYQDKVIANKQKAYKDNCNDQINKQMNSQQTSKQLINQQINLEINKKIRYQNSEQIRQSQINTLNNYSIYKLNSGMIMNPQKCHIFGKNTNKNKSNQTSQQLAAQRLKTYESLLAHQLSSNKTNFYQNSLYRQSNNKQKQEQNKKQKYQQNKKQKQGQ